MNDKDKPYAIAKRNKDADEAYEKVMEKARKKKWNDPKRVPWPVVMTQALAAYDAVILKWRKVIWGNG